MNSSLRGSGSSTTARRRDAGPCRAIAMRQRRQQSMRAMHARADVAQPDQRNYGCAGLAPIMEVTQS